MGKTTRAFETIYLDHDKLAALKQLSVDTGIPRAVLAREAIDDLLSKRLKETASRCTFCGRDDSETYLIPNDDPATAYICTDCVKACVRILKKGRADGRKTDMPLKKKRVAKSATPRPKAPETAEDRKARNQATLARRFAAAHHQTKTEGLHFGGKSCTGIYRDKIGGCVELRLTDSNKYIGKHTGKDGNVTYSVYSSVSAGDVARSYTLESKGSTV